MKPVKAVSYILKAKSIVTSYGTLSEKRILLQSIRSLDKISTMKELLTITKELNLLVFIILKRKWVNGMNEEAMKKNRGDLKKPLNAFLSSLGS